VNTAVTSVSVTGASGSAGRGLARHQRSGRSRRTWLRPCAVRALVIVGLMQLASSHAVGQVQEAEPPQEFNPKRAHVKLFPREAPDLRFYRRRDLRGLPAIRLNERGAFVGDQLVCAWPGGRYDSRNRVNMVLGYETPPEIGDPKYVPCPAGFPIISTWGDQGHGGAVLLIEVASRKGTLVEVVFQGQSYYLDLKSLPGDPSVPTRSGGWVGWYWQISGEEAEKAVRAAADRLRRRPAFTRFLREARACLSSANAPRCFISFVRETIYFPEARLGEYSVTAEQFTNAVWQRVGDDGHPLWGHLSECFASGDLSAGSRAATLTTQKGWTCELEETRSGWKLVRFFRNPDLPSVD